MILTRLRGLVAGLAILTFIVGAPMAMLRLGAIPTLTGFAWQDLLRQDDGTLLLQVLTAAAWIAWAWYAITILIELIALIRGAHAPRIPILPQTSAGRLVGAAALLFVTVPVVVPVLAPARAATAPPIPEPLPNPTVAPADPTPEATPAETVPEQQTVAYTVARGDSLWKIAETRLGAGNRYPEIVALNPAVLADDPDFLTPGTILKLPAPPAPSDDEETYVVQPGDTLTEIAQDKLHDANRYADIFTASQDMAQPDGARLTDPDEIRPGWTLTIPTSHEPNAPAPAPAPTDPPHPTPPEAPTPIPSAPTPSSSSSPTGDSAGTQEHAESADDTDESPSWLLPGLASAGAILAGGVFLVVRRNRRIQRRYRLPGHEIAPPPAELAPVEKTVRREGVAPAQLIEQLDLLLRMLPQGEHPRLLAAELGDNRITLHLAAPATLPTPWTGGDTVWTAPADIPTTDTGEVAPYPLLASIGQSDDGHLWLLNLEETAVLNIAGDPDHAEALARHLAADLAVTPWSLLVEVHAQGLGGELDGLDPVRLRLHDSDASFLDRIASDLDPSGRLAGFDPDRFRAIIVSKDSESVRRVAHVVSTDQERSGAAVVVVDAHPDLGAHNITLTPTGDLTISHPSLRDVRLRTAGLTTEEAALCVAIVEATRTTESQPMPVNGSATDGTAALIDEAGAVRPEYVHERPADNEPAGPTSLLPAAVDSFLDASATTSNDVHQLAPILNQPTRDRILALDPMLDEDLAEWHSPNCRLPKLILLGPVHLRAHGPVPDKRRPYHAELLAYLFLHPDGVRTAEYLEATGISRSRLTADISELRRWLSTNPRTGKEHLPDARETRAALQLGHPAYQADDILVDLDLFRRLRTRGMARGEDGITDLQDALRLVAGEPFAQLREAGWAWLSEGQRHDHIAVSMVVDTAHIVVTGALAQHDLQTAKWAAETATKAAPYDDVPRLDYARVLSASGHAGLADQYLDEHIYNRDDGLGRIDPPERSKRAAG